MMTEKISQGELLYHPVHGLCRVKGIIRQSELSKEGLYYSLVPRLSNQMKVRFVVAIDEIEISGFHLPVTLKEANEILEYLKTGRATGNRLSAEPDEPSPLIQDTQTWALARAIFSFSHDRPEAKDQRKRQMLDRSAKGLVRELAFVLGITVKETVAKVRRNLESTSKINRPVLAALAHALED